MNSAILFNISRFFLLLATQILVFNNLDLFGFLNPYPYILFIILFPIHSSKSSLILASFAIGITMDCFCDSGGVHAFACLILAYYRPLLFKFSFGLSYEYQTVTLNDSLNPQRFVFILMAVFIHHICVFVLEIFSVFLIWEMIYKTILTSIFTIALCIIIIYLIKPSKR
jgi:rod shape-determining protein MreD